jgi:hypothetical protein
MADIKESTADEGKDKDSVAYQKRREQVRRAQRYVMIPKSYANPS